ncbi:MAG: sulfur transferase domain-containing protein [Acidobacteriota bacterium]|nr:sulfur transferase domain-containing protein [Acidobacteriota bacterium]MDH3783805.1 sulfur transferase domain-containing protein [Acidobacteriota bacterium]
MLAHKKRIWIPLLGVLIGLACAGTPTEIRNLREPIPGVWVGGQPTREQLEALADDGFKTIVNLRQLDEDGAWDETSLVEELGMQFLHIPIGGAEGFHRENAERLAAVVDDPARQPALIHCASGNRVGALFAVKAVALDNATDEEALTLGRAAGLTRLADQMPEILASLKAN